MNKEKDSSPKCPICGKPPHKKSKYCIFHASAEEKTEKEFKEALKKYVNKIKEEDGDYNFKKFIFVGNINFKKDFNLIELQECNFENSEFNDSLYILNVNFLSQVNFSKATFLQSVEIKNTNFKEGMVSFNGAMFHKNLLIEYCKFKHHDIDFRHSGFHGNVKMGGEISNSNIFNFEGADINHNFELFFTSKEKIVIKLNNITNYPNFTKITIAANNANIYFNNADLEKTELLFELYNNTYIDFEKARIKDTYLRYNHIKESIIQEKNKNYEEAKEVYLILKNNFHSIGRYNDESLAFKKEMDMERAAHWIRNMKYNKPNLKEWLLSGHFKNWFCSAFFNMLYGYGENPENVVKTAIAIIILFALSFSLIGIANPEIIELNGTAIQQSSGNIVDLTFKGLIKNNAIRNVPDSLYFSLITFTTLGYGDFRPLEGWGRILAGSEAFIGAFMMALFVYTFARRTGGR